MEIQKKSECTKCIRCGKAENKVGGWKKKIKSPEDMQYYSSILQTNIQEGRFVCDKCRKLIYKHSKLTVHNCSVNVITSAGSSADSAADENSQLACMCISCCECIQEVGANDIEIIEPAEIRSLQSYLQKEVTAGDRMCIECYMVAERQLKEFSDPNCPPVEVQMESDYHTDARADSMIADFDSLSQSSSSSASSLDSVYEEEANFSNAAARQTSTVSRVEMAFSRVVSTHKYCFICGPAQTAGLCRIPLSTRLECYMHSKIYIPEGNRCCSHHMLHERFYAEDIQRFRIVSPTSLVEPNELQKFITQLTDLNLNNALIDTLDSHDISDEKLKVFTGLTSSNIHQLSDKMSSMRNTSGRSRNQALITFLMKLRTAQSNALIAATLGLKNQQTVAQYCDSIERSFSTDILPSQFGFKSHTREFLIGQTSPMAKRLHNLGDRLAIICDGTYLRHQKSHNNVYQKKSYSGQKKSHLCKPFTICTTNGFVIDVPGPFYANENDAQILRKVLEDENNDFKALLRPGDVFILDRGFRDVKGYLEEQGYTVLMPALRKKQDRQLTCNDANLSRLVTKVRWVVEAVHGAICQRFKYFHHQIHNTSLPKVGLLCRIVNYLHNEYGTRLGSDIDMMEDILEQIEKTKTQENPFAELVKEQNWNRKKLPFICLTSSAIDDFPILSEIVLKKFFTGIYQFGLAVAYLATLMKNDEILIKYLKESTNRTTVIRAEVPSRHTSKIYRCYLQYQPCKNDIDAITGYACECANGLRTIGTCAHNAAIIYYLSYARYQSRIVRPAEKLTELFNYDDLNISIEYDSDDDI